jgi:hypothetical protein
MKLHSRRDLIKSGASLAALGSLPSLPTAALAAMGPPFTVR